jgi:hypothetical protein
VLSVVARIPAQDVIQLAWCQAPTLALPSVRLCTGREGFTEPLIQAVTLTQGPGFGFDGVVRSPFPPTRCRFAGDVRALFGGQAVRASSTSYAPTAAAKFDSVRVLLRLLVRVNRTRIEGLA